MEVVDGVDFLRYLGSQSPQERDVKLGSCFFNWPKASGRYMAGKLLHRDLKPSNGIVTAQGRLVILDFGLVRSFEEGSHSLVTFAGTPDYMSPEQAAGKAATEASDWYAFGVMLYQSLTGRLPFAGNFVEVLHRKQLEIPIAPSDVAADIPPDLSALCIHLLDGDPAAARLTTT